MSNAVVPPDAACRPDRQATRLVSCIMATKDRHQFIPQALRCFQRQTYLNSELILVDDGEQSVANLCSGLPEVHHIRLSRPVTTGTKLNIGIECAHGDILQKLDDDDYYHPDFLKTAVSGLPTPVTDKVMVAWDCFLVLLAGDPHLRHSGPGWKAGGSLCFYRKLWECGPFRDVSHSEDYWFLKDHRARVLKALAAELYILVRHGGNTWNEMAGGVPADTHFRALPPYRKLLHELVHPDDVAFYESLSYQPL